HFADGGGLGSNRHPVFTEELTHLRPQTGRCALRLQPALAAILLHGVFTEIRSDAQPLGPRQFELTFTGAGAALAGYRQQIADGLAVQFGRDRHSRLHHSGAVIGTPITEIAVFAEQVATAAQAGADHYQGQCVEHRLHLEFLDGMVPRSHNRPHCFRASRTAGWQSSLRLVNGRRRPSSTRPISCSAHFTGIGLDSMNSFSCNGMSISFKRRAVSASPCKAATHRSCIALGATLAVTEILPLPPSRISSTAVGSSPE